SEPVIDETNTETVNEVVSEAVSSASDTISEAVNNTYETVSDTVSGVENAPKKKTGAKVAAVGVGAAVLLGGGGVAAYNLSDYVKNQVKLATMDAPEYYEWVMEENAAKAADSIAESYDEYIDLLGKGQKADVAFKYEASDAVKELLLTDLPASDETQPIIDLVNDIKSVSMGVDAQVKDNNMVGSVYANLNDESLVTIDMAVDYENLACYYRIPELKEQWLGMDLSDAMTQAQADAEYTEIMDKITAFSNNPADIISVKELDELITKYSTLWCSDVKNAELEKKKDVKIGDITVEYTVITAEIDGKTAYNMLESYVKTASEDKLLKEIVTERLEICSGDEFDTVLDEALTSLEDEKESMTEDDTTIDLITYVDPKGVVRGVSLVDPEGTEVIDYVIGLEDDDVYGELSLDLGEDGTYSAVLEAVKKKDAYTGDIEVFAGSDTLATVGFKDLEVVDEKMGYVSGVVSLTLPEIDPIELNLSSDGKSQEISLALNIDGTDYGKFIITTSSEEIEKVEMPDVKDAFMIDAETADLEGYVTEDEAMTFVSDLLAKLGIDEEMAEGLLSGMTAEDEYLEDDFQWDDSDWEDTDWDDTDWEDIEWDDSDWEEIDTEADNPYFSQGVYANSGQAYLNVMDYSWEAEYWGMAGDSLACGAVVADITGNGQYKVSVTADTEGYRFATTGDPNDASVLPEAIDYLSVCVVDGPDISPDMIITIDSIVIDGVEYPVTGECYTVSEFSEKECLIYCEWEEAPEDALSADGDASDATATIFDASSIENWTTIEVTFTVSGIA
ncbi:MAG: hypothetical protein IKM49_01045, partial [Ruminococcus sp.]|nr:hypothetical protein [Ruminococcus sp.]